MTTLEYENLLMGTPLDTYDYLYFGVDSFLQENVLNLIDEMEMRFFGAYHLPTDFSVSTSSLSLGAI
jgi:hypothetical protein